jgi:hypothetical protein
MANMNAGRGKEGVVAFDGPVAGSSSDARVSSWRPRRRELPPLGGCSTISKLMQREIGGLNGQTPPRPDTTFCAEKFRRFKLEVSHLAS